MRIDDVRGTAPLVGRTRALRPARRRASTAGRLPPCGGPLDVIGRGASIASLLIALAIGLSACGDSTSPTAPAPATPSSPSPSFSEAAFREAARITASAQVAARASARVGQFERDVKTAVDATFSREGAAPAFDHIVASGPNTLELHYAGSDRQLSEGDLLLIDIGATSSGHCADVTRTFPVSGGFTPRQLEIYQLVLDAHREAALRMRTGLDSIRSIDASIREFLRASPLRAKDADGADQTMDRFFIHSIGHYVGRKVHGEDTGWSVNAPVQPGQVLALEPGLYIAGEQIGIRIEDTFLVTTSGLECLSCSAPKER